MRQCYYLRRGGNLLTGTQCTTLPRAWTTVRSDSMKVEGNVSPSPSFAFSGFSPSTAQFGKFAMMMEFVAMVRGDPDGSPTKFITNPGRKFLADHEPRKVVSTTRRKNGQNARHRPKAARLKTKTSRPTGGNRHKTTRQSPPNLHAVPGNWDCCKSCPACNSSAWKGLPRYDLRRQVLSDL